MLLICCLNAVSDNAFYLPKRMLLKAPIKRILASSEWRIEYFIQMIPYLLNRSVDCFYDIYFLL